MLQAATVALAIWVRPGDEGRCDWALQSLIRAMDWDERVYGREYDLDIFNIVAVDDFNMGAMENKGLNIFNSKLVLASPETATDDDYARIEAIIAHEYFHNWTGNRITCRDWFQLCLKEGLTVYRDHEFSADQRSRAVKRVAEVRHLKAEQFAEDSGPLAHPVRPEAYREINNFYTTTVYEKGSEVTRMIATLTGKAGFRKGMDLYFERHDGEAATVEDFVKCFEDANGIDLKQFKLWYSQAGTPMVTVSTTYDAAEGTFTLALEQMIPTTPGQRFKKPMHIPLKFTLIGDNGTALKPAGVTGGTVSGDVLHLTERKQSFVFSGIAGRPVLSLNRGFSAPVNLSFDQTKDDLAHIARHDSDLFARWQALADLGMPVLVKATQDARKKKPIVADPTFISVLLETVGNDALEPAFRAQVLSLASEPDIARSLGKNNDPDAVHRGREAVLKAIADKGHATFERLYKELSTTGKFTPDAKSAGRRALRNAALSYLSMAEKSPFRAAEAFDEAGNMTELANALGVLAYQFPDSDETLAALAAFATRFDNNALVLDKWFSIQATIPGDDALERVKALMGDSRYNANNPNRVRALIGGLAFANPTGFNRADGAGYRLLAEQILVIDPKNPQLAARLLTAMRSWRSLEAGRAAHAKAALEMIAAAKPLSADVADIVDRMLKG